jgi:small-conductance mechanosensitive channel
LESAALRLLAAQETLENLLGGITLVMDNTLFIGDDCLISGRYVTIQNVGLRSTAAMTREGTDISFPNGMLVQNRYREFVATKQVSDSYNVGSERPVFP